MFKKSVAVLIFIALLTVTFSQVAAVNAVNSTQKEVRQKPTSPKKNPKETPKPKPTSPQKGPRR